MKIIATVTNVADVIHTGGDVERRSAIASILTNKKFILIEKDPQYYEIAKHRIIHYSNNINQSIIDNKPTPNNNIHNNIIQKKTILNPLNFFYKNFLTPFFQKFFIMI